MSNETKLQNDSGCDLGDEESLCAMMASTFRGKLAWMAMVVYVYIFVFFAIAVIAAVQFFQVETTRGMILSAAVFIVSFVVIAVSKVWFWGLMFRNSLLKRIDRLEKHIAAMHQQD